MWKQTWQVHLRGGGGNSVSRPHALTVSHNRVSEWAREASRVWAGADTPVRKPSLRVCGEVGARARSAAQRQDHSEYCCFAAPEPLCGWHTSSDVAQFPLVSVWLTLPRLHKGSRQLNSVIALFGWLGGKRVVVIAGGALSRWKWMSLQSFLLCLSVCGLAQFDLRLQSCLLAAEK